MDERARRIINYLKKNVLANPDQEIRMSTPLVTSGLIDSFSLVELLNVLEEVTGKNLPAGRIGPQDLDSVERMLAVADRWGTTR